MSYDTKLLLGIVFLTALQVVFHMFFQFVTFRAPSTLGLGFLLGNSGFALLSFFVILFQAIFSLKLDVFELFADFYNLF